MPNVPAINGSSDRPVRIGLLGCGTVGQAFVRTIAGQGETIARASGRRLEIGPILVRDLTRTRPGIASGQLTTDPQDVLSDPDVDLIVEVMGGIEPTATYLRQALQAGTPVVTANKQLLSRHGAELLRLAEASGTELRFEASACAAIPVIKVLRESLLAAEISAVTGIVNGTTNYILTEMARGGLSYEQALAQAQQLGYAEADPTEDVGGADAAAKMAILASIAFHTNVQFDDVPYEGIDGVQAEDLELARDLGFVVKLLGVARLAEGGITVRVHPALVPERHRLAAVSGPDNAVLLESGHRPPNHARGAWCRWHGDRLGGARRRPVDPRHGARGASCRIRWWMRAGRCSNRTRPSRPSTSGSRSQTDPACSPRSPRCSPMPVCRSAA